MVCRSCQRKKICCGRSIAALGNDRIREIADRAKFLILDSQMCQCSPAGLCIDGLAFMDDFIMSCDDIISYMIDVFDDVCLGHG